MEHKIVQRDINSLIFAEYNPRQLTKEQYKHLRDSIERFGLVDPIIVNKNKERKNIIVGGHQRVRVAKDMKIEIVPVLEVDLNYDRERELNVRLNRNTGEWDFDVLANMFELEELENWGFNDKELKIYDIEDEEEIKPEIAITPELYESHNYVLLYFDNEIDWQTAQEVLEIKTVLGKKKKIQSKGLGRVINGAKVLKKLL